MKMLGGLVGLVFVLSVVCLIMCVSSFFHVVFVICISLDVLFFVFVICVSCFVILCFRVWVF